MIYVTQGHERGIGLEIFLKSFLALSFKERKKLTLIVNQKDLDDNLRDAKLSKNLFKDLNTVFVTSDSKEPSSTKSLLWALEHIKETDILVTLPTSKDQLIFNKKNMAGYTEFFRAYYKNPNISMTFKGINENVLLVTDHLPLKKVASTIDKDLIINKVNTTTHFFEKYFFKFDQIIFSGINPHAGENGILGDEEKEIHEAMKELKKDTTLSFLGPYSGDTLHMLKDETKKQLFVYMFHDQGLAPFKSHYGLVGLNISMGLPFLRLSVDHGTAFHLYGKNKANITGMMFLLKQAFEVISHVN
jgi:4-hydroxythreonine-4-phosphate dehydrogenase